MKRRGNVDICPLASSSNHITLLSQLALPHADALNKGLLKFWPRAQDMSAPHRVLSIYAKFSLTISVALRSEKTLLLREISYRKPWNVNFR